MAYHFGRFEARCRATPHVTTFTRADWSISCQSFNNLVPYDAFWTISHTKASWVKVLKFKMATKMFRKSVYLLSSIFTRSSATSTSNSYLLQNSKWSYVISRDYSLVCSVQRVKATCTKKELTTHRAIAHSTG